MSTVTAHIRRRCRPLLASAVLVPSLLLALAANAPGASGEAGSGAAFTQTRSVAHRHGVRPSYGWPVKPFNRQHPVRAYLDDPRNGDGDAKSFHLGSTSRRRTDRASMQSRPERSSSLGAGWRSP